MKKIAIYAVAAMLAIGGAANVAAATDMVGPKLTYNENNTNATHGEVIITGTLEGVAEGELVSLTVYESTKTVATGLKWYDQKKAGVNGAYEFSCVLEGTTGTGYIFSVAAEGHIGEQEIFTYYPKAKATEIVSGITTGTTVSDAITNYNTFVQIDTAIYDTLSAGGQTTVCNNVAAEIQAIRNTGKTPTASDFKEAFADCSKVEKLNEISTNSEYKTELTKVATEEVPAVAEIFAGLSNSDAIVAEMNAINYTSKASLLQDFNNKVLKTAANDAQVAAEMENLVTSAANELGIDLTAFNALSVANKATVMNKMLQKNNYTGCADIKATFEAAIATVTTPAPGGGSGSGGSAGGGSSSGGGTSFGSMPTPVVVSDPFNDLGSVSWAKDSVRKLFVKGIISGDQNGNFNPNNNVTRAEYVKMLVSAMNMLGKGTGLEFDDVKSDAWYHDYVIAAAENELVSGMTESSFGPNLPITRQDAAVIIYRAVAIKNISLDATNSDKIADEAEIAGYAKDAVKALFASELLNGVGDGKFAPKANMTRAQAAVIMCSFLERMEALN